LAQLWRHRPLDLLDRPGRKAQIDGAAGLVAQPVAFRGFALGIALDVVEGKREDRRELVDECRLEGGEPVLGEPNERGCDRLVRAAFGRQRDARRRRRQNEAGVLVAGVVERIEPALNERVVERADRDEALAVDRVREDERGEENEQIHLGDAELDVLASGREIPTKRRGNALAAERIGERLAGKYSARVHPGAEIGLDGYVRIGGDAGRRGRGVYAGCVV